MVYFFGGVGGVPGKFFLTNAGLQVRSSGFTNLLNQATPAAACAESPDSDGEPEVGQGGGYAVPPCHTTGVAGGVVAETALDAGPPRHGVPASAAPVTTGSNAARLEMEAPNVGSRPSSSGSGSLFEIEAAGVQAV